MAAVLHTYVLVFLGDVPLDAGSAKEALNAIRFIRTMSSWDGVTRKSPEQEAEDRRLVTEKWDYIKTLRFEDSRRRGVPIHWQDVVFTERSHLYADDLQRMNLPLEFHADYKLDGPEAHVLRRYVLNLGTARQDGVGLYLFGPPHTGKTRAAAATAKAIASYRHVVYFTTLADLREHIRTKTEFEHGMSAIEKCKKVEFLVLDNLRVPDEKDVFFNTAAIEDLLKTRKSWKRPTLITSRLTPREVKDGVLSGVLPVLNEACLQVPFTRVHETQTAQADIKAKFGVKK
jgi:DNA replication protein DnaC